MSQVDPSQLGPLDEQAYSAGLPLPIPTGLPINQELLDAAHVGEPPPPIANRHPVRERPWDFGNPIVGFIADVLSALPPPFDAIGAVFPAVVDWVAGAISTVADWAATAFSDVLSFIWDDLLSPILNFVARWVRDLYGFVYDLFGEVIDLARGAWDFVQNAASWLLDQLASAADFLWTLIEPFVQLLWNDLIKPVLDGLGELVDLLLHAAADLGGWLWDEISQIAQWVFDDLIKPVLAGIGDLVNAALDALGIAWDVLKAAWDWIVWFAEHTFTDIEDLITNGWSLSAHGVLNLIVKALHDDGDTIEHAVAGFFG